MSSCSGRAFAVLLGVILFALGRSAVADDTIIGVSYQTSATERNNARLIAIDRRSNLHAVFYSNGLYHSISRDDGINWSKPALIQKTGRRPSIAVDSKNTVHLVYQLGGIDAHDIAHQTFKNNAWSSLDIVQHSVIPVTFPVITIDKSDNLHCVWQRKTFYSRPSDVFYNRCNDGSNWQTTAINLSRTRGASEYPTLLSDSKNRLHVFWKDSGNDITSDKKVFYRSYSPATGWDEDHQNVSNTLGNKRYATMNPCAIVDDLDNIHLVWKDVQSDSGDIYYRKRIDQAWENEFINISHSANSSSLPQVAIDNDNNLHFVWSEKVGRKINAVYKAYNSASGTWSKIETLSDSDPEVDSKFINVPARFHDYLPIIWTRVSGDLPYQVIYKSIRAPQAMPTCPKER